MADCHFGNEENPSKCNFSNQEIRLKVNQSLCCKSVYIVKHSEKNNKTRGLLSTLVWAVQPELYWFTQRLRNVQDTRRHMKFIFSIAFKSPLGFRVQPQCQKKNWHLDRWIKICHVKCREWHRNEGRVECMCSFNLQYMFPPSLAVRAPRCAANETPLSGYSSWKLSMKT